VGIAPSADDETRVSKCKSCKRKKGRAVKIRWLLGVRISRAANPSIQSLLLFAGAGRRRERMQNSGSNTGGGGGAPSKNALKKKKKREAAKALAAQQEQQAGKGDEEEGLNDRHERSVSGTVIPSEKDILRQAGLPTQGSDALSSVRPAIRLVLGALAPLFIYAIPLLRAILIYIVLRPLLDYAVQ
jgi:hypothetical protein